MSHLLSTVNPDAVAELDPAKLPSAGDIVIFVARPGEGRRGRSLFPAVVIAPNGNRGNTGLDLVVIYDASDFGDYDSVQQESDQQPAFCWRRKESLSDVIVDSNAATIELAGRLDLLNEKIYGGWEAPPKSMMDYLADFEKRLNAVEALAPSAPKKAKA